jgi:uncharacterized OB-fold protein
MTPSITDQEVLEAYPTVPVDQDSVNHFRGRLERRLLINHCEDCGHWHQPPRSVCPRCWSNGIEACEVSGQGTLALVTVLHRGTPVEGIDYEAGYVLGAVELREQPGLRFTAPLVDVPSPHLGMPMQLTWIQRQGAPVPAFTTAEQ